ncbi:MAG: tetratricopeptide (TPR) repeat protein [Pseudohongiellaceae bacterium]|jgi:tetratricopeptide (TPR) repeat protein
MTPTGTPEGAPNADMSPATSASPAKGGKGLAGLVLFLLSVALYLPTVDHNLVYDDLFLISPELNSSMIPVVDDLGASLQLFNQEYWNGVNPEKTPELSMRGQALYRPLTLFIWAVILNQAPQPFNLAKAVPYHWVSILVNGLVVLLFFLLVAKLFESNRVAFLAAAIYALHPLHSEAVAYVAGLSDQLATLTVLVGMLFFLRAIRPDGSLGLGALFGLIVTLFVGLLAKESAVLVIAAIALTDVMWTLRGRGLALAHRAMVYGGSMVALACHVALRYRVLGGKLQPDENAIGMLDNPLIKLDTDLRILNSFKLLAKYVWLTLWPKDLSVDYSFNAIKLSNQWSDPEPLAGMILVGALLIVGLVSLRRSPAFGWGLIFFTGTAIFTSNMIVPIGTIFAERLMYLPTLGAALALGFVFDRLMASGEGGKGTNPIGLFVLVIALSCLGWRTFERNKDFKNSVDLFRSAEKVVPDSARVHYQLGSLYATEGRIDSAVKQFESALDDDGSFIQAAIRLGDVHNADRNFERAILTYTDVYNNIDMTRSINEQAKAVQSMVLRKRAASKRSSGDIDGALADLQEAMNLGMSDTPDAVLAWVRIQQNNDNWAETVPLLEQTLVEFPEHVALLTAYARASVSTQDREAYEDALVKLKNTKAGRPLAMAMEAEVMYEQSAARRDHALRDEAMSLFEEVIDLNDRLATPFYYRGRYLGEKQRAFRDAIVEYDKAIARDPDHPMALFYKALAYMELNDLDGALASLETLTTVRPNVSCYALMAEVYFKLGDVEKQEEVNAKLEELGKAPVQMTINRAVSFGKANQPERGLEIMEQLLIDPENAASPEVLRTYGLLLFRMGRCDEALANFEAQAQAQLMSESGKVDPFVDVNRARAYACLGQWAQALSALDLTSAKLAQYDDRPGLQNSLRASILQRQAEYLLERDTAVFNATLALAATNEGLDVTGRNRARLFDLEIEALVALNDLSLAIDRTNEAAALLFGLKHYPVLLEALEQATSGDRAGAAITMRAFTAQAEDPGAPQSMERIAGQL